MAVDGWMVTGWFLVGEQLLEVSLTIVQGSCLYWLIVSTLHDSGPRSDLFIGAAS